MINQQRPSLDKAQRLLILERARYQVLMPLDGVIGYSEILCEEFSYEYIVHVQDLKAYNACLQAIKSILKQARILQKKVDLTFSTALIELHHRSFDLGIFLRSLQQALLTPAYAIIGNYELLLEHGISSYGAPLENDALKIHEAAQQFINSINKLAAQGKSQNSWEPSLRTQLSRNIEASLRHRSLKQELSEIYTVSGTVLIIEDNTLVLELLQRQIEFFGYKALAGDNYDKALNILNHNNIDLIILQIIMLKNNGFETLKKLKHHSLSKHLPLIAIGPLKGRDVAQKCFALGAIDYLTQPLQQLIFKTRLNDCIEKKKLVDKEKEYRSNTEEQIQSIEHSLRSSLPPSIIDRLKQDTSFIAERSEEASVLFADIAEFSQIVELLSPQKIVRMLNIIFSAFDAIMHTYKVEKIKTIGDNYMAIAGLPEPNHHHAEAIAYAALEMMTVMQSMAEKFHLPIHLRIGINSGPVVAGIIGTTKLIYDAWGKTVNLASRIETQGRAQKIQVSESTYDLLKTKFEFTYRGEVDLRSFGAMKLYYLLGPKRKLSRTAKT